MSALDLPLEASAPAPNFKRMFATWRARVRFRHELWRLLKDKPELLDDIGLTAAMARAECDKAFWQACEPFPRRSRSGVRDGWEISGIF